MKSLRTKNLTPNQRQQDEQTPAPRRRWDYSSDPLKDGGEQIVIVVVGIVLMLVLSVLLLLGISSVSGPRPGH